MSQQLLILEDGQVREATWEEWVPFMAKPHNWLIGYDQYHGAVAQTSFAGLNWGPAGDPKFFKTEVIGGRRDGLLIHATNLPHAKENHTIAVMAMKGIT